MIIAVDFDGTLCENAFPGIGAENKEVVDFLRHMKDFKDATIILWTCREGRELREAVDWCRARMIPIDHVNENVPEIAKQNFAKRKIYADIYLDDRNLYIGDDMWKLTKMI